MEVEKGFCSTLQSMGCFVDLPRGFLPREKLCLILQDCAKQKKLEAGRHLHSLMQKAGLVSIAPYGDHLIHMFASCASLVEAEHVFWHVSTPSVYTWNAIISGHTKLGKSEKALDYYHRMQCDVTVKADKITYLSVVKSCSSIRALHEGHLMHSQILEGGFGKDLFLANALIDLYAKCGSFDDAQQVLNQMPRRDVVSWGAIVSGYAQHGQGLPALELLQRMYEEGTEPNKVIFLCSLKACACMESLQLGNLVHQQIVENAFDLDVTVGNTLIDMYVKCRRLEEAWKVFHCLPCRTVVSWGAMIAGYARHGLGHTSLQLFQKMQEKGVQPNMVIVLCVIKACGAVGALDQGKIIHRQVCNSIKKDVMVGNALIEMYTKCGYFREAREVFDEMQNRDSASYDAMIAGYAQCDNALLALELLDNMQQEFISPNRSTLLNILEVCGGTLAYGHSAHFYTSLDGFDSDTTVGSGLVVMYSKHGCVEEAREVFDGLSSWDLVAWGAIIAVYSDHGQGLTALQLYEIMQEEGVKPSMPIFLSALKACASISCIKEGRTLHDEIITRGFESDSLIGSSLTDMYAKCGGLLEALNVFRNLQMRDLVSWCSIISGYALQGHGEYALELFEEMLLEGLEPDKGVLLSVSKACSCIEAIDVCRLVHVCVISCGLESDVIVGSTILDLYWKCGSIEEAYTIFCVLPKRFSAPWNAMMAGYLRYGDSVSALQLLQKMQQERVELEKVMILSLLKVCGSMGAVKQGRLIHDVIIGSRLESDIMFGNALVDMHAKCGGIQEAMKVFNSLPCKDMVSWGAIIAAFTRHGHFEKVSNCARQMQAAGLKPTRAIFTNILSACSHGGIQEAGYLCFKSMEDDYAIPPRLEQYSGMVDLFSRAGRLDEAEDLLQSMPVFPDLLGWTSLLTSCKTYGNVGMGRLCYEHLSQLDPGDAAGHVLMSNIYGDVNMWNEVEKVKETRKHAGLFKKPGRAWIEIDGRLQGFVVGDVNQPQTIESGSKSRKLLDIVRELGYVPQVGLDFKPLTKDMEEEKSIEPHKTNLLDLRRFVPSSSFKANCLSQDLNSFSDLLVCLNKQEKVATIL